MQGEKTQLLSEIEFIIIAPHIFYKCLHRLLKWVTDLQTVNLQSSLILHLHGALAETEELIACLCRQERL